MPNLTDEGRVLVDAVAHRHNISADAVLSLIQALERGGGMQAQFSHPDLGGMGQWSRGGMIMVGDMFNNGLKARVDQLCNELSDALNTHTIFEREARGAPWGTSWSGSAWWPADFGAPSASGSQNDMRYACFPDTRRLAIQRGGVTSLYDTGDHRIGGVSQQQSGGQDLTFTSQYGTVQLHELALVGNTSDATRGPTPLPNRQAPDVERPASVPARPAALEDDVFAKIERLHALQQKGILSDAEFAEKKKELLARL